MYANSLNIFLGNLLIGNERATLSHIINCVFLMKYIGNGRCEHMLTLNASPDILNVSSHEIYSTRFT